MLALSSPVQASLLDELGHSLLSGPSVEGAIIIVDERPVSLQDPIEQTEQGFAGNWLNHSNDNEPGLFLMPVGRSDELGVGVGIRFPF